VEGGPRHENTTPVSYFHVWGVGNIQDMKTTTMQSHSLCLDGSEVPKQENQAHMGTILVFGWKGGEVKP